MNYQREANIVHNNQEGDEGWKTVGNQVATLETENRFVDICYMNAHFPKLKNRFSVLAETDDDVDEDVRRKGVDEDLRRKGGDEDVRRKRFDEDARRMEPTKSSQTVHGSTGIPVGTTSSMRPTNCQTGISVDWQSGKPVFR